MQNTDFFDIKFTFFLFVIWLTKLVVAAGREFHFQLVVHILGMRDPIRDFTDETLFLCGDRRPAQSDPAINGDELHVRPAKLHRTEPRAPRIAGPMTLGASEFAPLPLKLCRAKAGQPELPEPSPARRSDHTPNSGCAARWGVRRSTSERAKPLR